MSVDLVRAAGAAVHRHGTAGAEVLLVHRARYRDWSLPKGKLEPGETWLEAAVREVAEETGASGVFGAELTGAGYFSFGRPKLVRYWALAWDGGEVAAANEVDEVCWLPLAEAGMRVDRRTDRVVIDSLRACLATQPPPQVHR